MPRLRNAEQALRLFADASRQPYVCRACRASTVRQLHSSGPSRAELPFFKRIQQSLFGSKESSDAEKKQDEKIERRKKEFRALENDVAEPAYKMYKGEKYRVVAPVDLSTSRSYVPAKTWDGLESVGSEQHVKAKSDPGVKYAGFVPANRIKLSDDLVTKLLHWITIEVLTLQKAGRDLDEVCLSRHNGMSEGGWKQASRTTIAVDTSTSTISLVFPFEQVEKLMLQGIPRKQDSSVRSAEGALNADQLHRLVQHKPTGYQRDQSSWMDMPLQNPKMKLTIVKRLMQLTGHRIPDPVISNARTLRDLHSALKVKEKPKKLANTAELKGLDLQAPNVRVHTSRQTPIHREKHVGRWKLIEEALIARDLPVTGSRWQNAKPPVAP